MKKMKFIGATTLVIAALLLCSQHARAQFGFSIGPKAGFTMSTLRGADATNIKGRTTGLVGLFANVQLGKVIALQPELLLTRRGANVTVNNTASNFKVNYFEVPVLLKIRFPLANEVIFPHLLVGPNFAFRTNMNLSSRDTQSGTTITTSGSDVRKSDIGAVAGAGIDIQTRSSGLFFTIDGRYGWGFRNVYSNNNVSSVTLKNAGWMFAAGLGFRIGNSGEK